MPSCTSLLNCGSSACSRFACYLKVYCLLATTTTWMVVVVVCWIVLHREREKSTQRTNNNATTWATTNIPKQDYTEEGRMGKNVVYCEFYACLALFWVRTLFKQATYRDGSGLTVAEVADQPSTGDSHIRDLFPISPFHLNHGANYDCAFHVHLY